MLKDIKLSLALFFLAIVLSGLYQQPFYWNRSASLPYTIFIKSFSRGARKNLRVGDYVVFSHPSMPKIKLVKRIEALPGDRVWIKEDLLLVNEKPICYLDATEKERVKDQVLPKDHFFVLADHARSFDSRFEAFGLVKRADIESVVWPLM